MDKALIRIAILSIFVALVACESDSNRTSRDAIEPNDPPRLTDTFPNDGASEIDTIDPIVLTFSEEVDQSSLREGGVRIFVEQQEQPAEFEFDVDLAIIPNPDKPSEDILVDISVVEVTTPNDRFALSTEYKINVTSDVFDTGDEDGNNKERLQSNVEIAFLTRDGEWKTASRVDLPSTGDVFNPKLTSNQQGNIYMAWSQDGGAVNDIWVSKYEIGSGIVADRFVAASDENLIAERIETNDLGSALEPELLVTEQGVLVVVWQLAEGSARSLRANVFNDGAWLGEVEIEDLSGDISDVVLTEGANGEVIVAWRQDDGERFNIWSSIFDISAVDTVSGDDGWSDPENIEADSGTAALGDARSPVMETNTRGVTYLVWVQMLDGVNRVWSASYSPASGWGEPELIDSDSSLSSENPDVAFGPTGDGLAIWQEFDGDRYNIRSNRLVTGIWSTSELVEVDNRGDAVFPMVDFDDRNSAIGVWRQFDGTNSTVRAQIFSPSEGWNNLETIGQSSGEISAPMFAFDSEGNGIAIWHEGPDSVKSIQANRYSQFGGWQGEVSVEDFANVKSLDPQLAEFFNDGRHLAAWYQIEDDGSYSISINTFK